MDIDKAILNSKGYALKRDYVASARLTLQHYHWREEAGFLLHPQIKLDCSKPVAIADIGTGNCIWMEDLSKMLPETVQFDGFDVSLAQAPPTAWLSPNVATHELDMLQDIPGHFIGKYDVVHVRLFVFVVQHDDPGPLLQKMLKMLKPGGYLQWSEYDYSPPSIIKARPDLDSSAHEQLVKEFFTWTEGTGPSWIERLPDIVGKNGFELVAQHRTTVPTQRLQYYSDAYLMFVEEIAPSLYEPDDLAKFHQLLQRVAVEARAGVCTPTDRLTTVGRKPATAT